MLPHTAQKIVDYIFLKTPADEKIEFGFFGGEPLLELELIKTIINIIRGNELYTPERVNLTVTTNGTILDTPIIDFLTETNVLLCISCDGPPEIQNRHRRFKSGKDSAALVEQNLGRALSYFPSVPVNAVYSPETLEALPEVVDYLVSLGVERIFLNPDISARWTKKEADILPTVFSTVGSMYLNYHLQKKPKYISLIDSKIAIILKGGYQLMDKCRMGDGELAFAPSGNAYPCERLIGSDTENTHRLGNIYEVMELGKRCHHIPTDALNTECLACDLSGYCMNWCGCTNFAMAGRYDAASPFLCASEKASISVALDTLRLANERNVNLAHNLAGAGSSHTACT